MLILVVGGLLYRQSNDSYHDSPFSWRYDDGLQIELLWDEVTADNVNHAALLSTETERYSYTPLQTAIIEDNEEGVKKCLALGADPELRVESMHVVLQPGTEDSYHYIEGYPPLHLAVALKRYRMVELLLRAGADIESRAPSHGYTPLMEAAFWGDAEMVSLLLSHGADARALTGGEWCFEYIYEGQSALDIAREQGHAACVELLLR